MNKHVYIAVMDYRSSEIRIYHAVLPATNIFDNTWAVQNETIEDWLEENDQNWSESQCYYMAREDEPIEVYDNQEAVDE